MTTQPRPERCLRCHRPLRPSGSPLSAHPGTLAHCARGHCDACYRRLMNGRPGLPQLGPRIYDVDTVVVELAVDHATRVDMNPAERRLAIQQLTARGHSAAQIAHIIGCCPRTVQRHRHGAPLLTLGDAA